MEHISNIQKLFIERLKDLMIEKNLNIKQLSTITNIPRTTISGWFNAEKLPSLEALIKLCDFFVISLDYLTGREN